jgi:hypothetical protein
MYKTLSKCKYIGSLLGYVGMFNEVRLTRRTKQTIQQQERLVAFYDMGDMEETNIAYIRFIVAMLEEH